MSAHRGRASFTLVELLAVLSVVAIAMALFLATNGRRDRRSLQVRAEAEQLAAVLRDTRARAMDRKAIYGVAFNIANAPGSNGHTLNNRSGGHWYRVIGPTRSNAQQDRRNTGYGGYTGVWRFNRDVWAYLEGGGDMPLSMSLNEIANDWVGPANVLPRGAVRFLALADQDNGNNRYTTWRFGPTYPRPWFGSWDPVSHQLYAWGGYDASERFLEFSQNSEWWSAPLYSRQGRAGYINYSGFYYEGEDGRIAGCVDPFDRFVLDDTDRSGLVDARDRKTFQIEKAGESRPLVNAAWLDAVILFYPDGTARYDDWYRLRHEYARYSRDPQHYFNEDTKNNLYDLAFADRCNVINTWEMAATPYNNRYEASHFVDRTGFWYLTLAPDAVDDNDTFATPQAALESISPMWRVGVSALGEVRVVEVHKQAPPGVTLDATHCDAWWQTPSLGTKGYYNNLLGSAMPVEDFVTAEMLRHRQWWLAP